MSNLIEHFVCPAVAAALALEELDRLKALEALPTTEALQEALQGRSGDFHLVAGVALGYLRNEIRKPGEA
jgi:hypothetical protein